MAGDDNEGSVMLAGWRKHGTKAGKKYDHDRTTPRGRLPGSSSIHLTAKH